MLSTTTQPAAGSGIPARGLSTSDRARRGVDIARSYGLGLRLADNLHGFVDARRTDAPVADLPWVARLEATYAENARRILAGTRDVVGRHLLTLNGGEAAVATLADQLAQAEARLAAVTVPNRGPGAGEVHLGPEAVRARTEQAAEGRRAKIRAEVARIEAARAAELARVQDARTAVEEEFAMAAEIVRRMRDFYQRRVTTYARRFLRRREDVTTLRHLLALPDWVDRPCPWLPTPDATPQLHVVH